MTENRKPKRRTNRLSDEDPPRPLTESEQAVADALKAAAMENYDPVKALNHRFEYHIYHAGIVHRIGRVHYDDVWGLIGEWVGERLKDVVPSDLIQKPVHVFMDGSLWAVLKMQGYSKGMAIFEEVSIAFGLVHEAELLDEMRTLTWTVDKASAAEGH